MAAPPVDVSLRQWEASDAPALLAAYDGTGMTHQRPGQLHTLADAERYIDDWAESSRTGYAHVRAVVTGDDVPVGWVGVGAIDRHDCGWVSYWTVEAQRGRGIAVAGLRLLSDWCFAEVGLHRLELGHRLDNPGSCRVALAAGYAVEGVERDKLRYGDVRHDVERHARLATDVG